MFIIIDNRMKFNLSFNLAKEHFSSKATLSVSQKSNWINNFNINPGKQTYIICSESPKVITPATWGLVVKDERTQSVRHLDYANIEGIFSSTSYRIPIRSRRCVILMDSFYLWMKNKGQEYPNRIYNSSRQLMTVAGVYSTHKIGDETEYRFSIITTKPNNSIKHFEQKVPYVFRDTKDITRWLSGISVKETHEILQRPSEDGFSYYRVSDKLGENDYNDPELHEPVKEALTLFD